MSLPNQEFIQRDFCIWLAGVAGSAAVFASTDPNLRREGAELLEQTLRSWSRETNLGEMFKVVSVDEAADTLRLNFRGNLGPVFARLEITISRDVDPDNPLLIRIVEVHAMMIEFTITESAFVLQAGLGWENRVLYLRGGLDLKQLQVYVGAYGVFGSNGFVVALDVKSPVPLPLATTGLGMRGLGGTYAQNFMPKVLEEIASPTAEDLVKWAKESTIDSWKPAPLDRGAVGGMGIRCHLATLVDGGKVLALSVGVLVLVPGPTIVIGGEGKLLDSDQFKCWGFIVVDGVSQSLALGLGVEFKLPASPSAGIVSDDRPIVEASGALKGFFSWGVARAADGSQWYLNVGTEKEPITVSLLWNLAKGTAYVMLNDRRVLLGVSLSLGGEWDLVICKLVARIGARFRLEIGWNPAGLGVQIGILGEIGLKKLLGFIDLLIGLDARVSVVLSAPSSFEMELKIKFCLIFFCVDPVVKFALTDRRPDPPAVAAPLLESERESAGAVHPLSAQQWELPAAGSGEWPKIWPDAEVALAFTERARDLSGKVVGDQPEDRDQGAYRTRHEIQRITVRRAEGTELANFRAVWAGSPAGSTASLRLFGQDPFNWIAANNGRLPLSDRVANPWEFVFWSTGPYEPVTAGRSFGRLRFSTATQAELTNLAGVPLGRVLRATALDFNFGDLALDGLRVHTIEVEEGPKFTGWRVVNSVAFGAGYTLVTWEPVEPVAGARSWQLGRQKGPVHVWAIAFRVKQVSTGNSFAWNLLSPGRYTVAVEGRSIATPLDVAQSLGMPGREVPWTTRTQFEVELPTSLRSYIAQPTFGDYRLFQTKNVTEAWNPTPTGIGFPHYRVYLPVVQFKTSYMKQMFPTLQLRDASPASARVTSSAIGARSLTDQQRQWRTALGWPVEVDDEVVFPLLAGVDAGYRLQNFSLEADGRVLDQWTAAVSRYRSAASHLTLAEPRLSVFQTVAGPRNAPAPEAVIAASPSGVLPAELPGVRADWRLPNEFAELFGPLDAQTGTRFLTFVERWRGAGRRPEVLERPAATRLEALLDASKRVVAFWLRTDEPVDWRRVNCKVVVRHFVPGSKRQMSRRPPMRLTATFLPSPDGCSAFVRLEREGVPVFCPAGEYDFRWTYSFNAAHGPRLRNPDGTVRESFGWSIVQPQGETWPYRANAPRATAVFNVTATAAIRRQASEIEIEPPSGVTLAPDAVLIVSKREVGGIRLAQTVGVFYNVSRRRWSIVTMDGAPIPDGARFSVALFPLLSSFRHQPSQGGTETELRSPWLDDNPDARFLITGIVNSSSEPNPPHGVRAFYREGRWRLFRPGGMESWACNVAIVTDAIEHASAAVVDHPVINNRTAVFAIETGPIGPFPGGDAVALTVTNGRWRIVRATGLGDSRFWLAPLD